MLCVGLFASLILTGVTFAQLNIPTTLDNAVITIKKIFLSHNGVATESDPNVKITLDGSNWNITTKGNVWASGNLTVWGKVQLDRSDFTNCGAPTGCILRVVNGEVGTTDNVTAWTNTNTNDTENKIFKRTSSTQPNNIFLATDDGNEATAGKNPTQSYLRVWVTQDNLVPPEKTDTAMIVGGSIESRWGLYIKKTSGESNQWDNKKVNLDNVNYSSLDIIADNWYIQLKSKKFDNIDGNNPTAFIFSADGATTKVGINTTSIAGPQKNLDVNGNAAISQNLTIGHPSTFDPGLDKLAVNGSTRANAYYYNSDRRYKSDIEVLQSPLENLLKLSGYSYYNKLSGKKDIGVIAQEVEAVYPDLVQTNADGYKSVAYGNLVAPIIEAIKELATKIDNLFNLYVSQQTKIDMLEARLLKLEANK